MTEQVTSLEKEIARLRNQTVEIDAMKKSAAESRDSARKAEAEQRSFRSLVEEKEARTAEMVKKLELAHAEAVDKKVEEHELTLVRHARELDAMHLENEKLQVDLRAQHAAALKAAEAERVEAVASVEAASEEALENQEKAHSLAVASAEAASEEALRNQEKAHSSKLGELAEESELQRKTHALEVNKVKTHSRTRQDFLAMEHDQTKLAAEEVCRGEIKEEEEEEGGVQMRLVVDFLSTRCTAHSPPAAAVT